MISLQYTLYIHFKSNGLSPYDKPNISWILSQSYWLILSNTFWPKSLCQLYESRIAQTLERLERIPLSALIIWITEDKQTSRKTFWAEHIAVDCIGMAEESRSLRELLFERVDKLAGFMQIVIWLIGDCLANPFRSIEVLAKRIGRGGCREIGNNVASVRERESLWFCKWALDSVRTLYGTSHCSNCRDYSDHNGLKIKPQLKRSIN